MQLVALLSLATAVPRNEIDQRAVVQTIRELFAHRFSGFERMAAVFDNAGVASRQSVMPLDWYKRSRGWAERSEAYARGATELFVEAAEKALFAASLRGADVDAIVTVSSTGIATPTLEARAARRLGFRPDVERVPIFGLGCAAGVTGLTTAARLAREKAGKIVLFVAVEACTLAFRLDELTKANMIACALFGDGAAACVLREGGGGIARIGAGAEYMWPDTLDIMGWAVDDTGLGVILNRSIPEFAAANLGEGVAFLLRKIDMSPADVGRFVCHPGGARVVEAIESSLALGAGSLALERDVLRDHGNMSAPTVLFVLERLLREGLPERAAMLALGPGFTLSALALSRPG